jgi:tetratricopeptide (TPR) repeat protein
MSDSFKRWPILALAFLVPCFFSASASATPQEPLRDSEVLALVAGAVLPVNVVHEISARGLDFAPDEAFRSQLKAAGADPTILAVLRTAKTSAGNASDTKSHQQILQHLVAAAQKMNAKKYDDAAVELNAALSSGPESPAVGFVMGEVLRATGRNSEAVAVYAEVLKQNPNFPEAHTKLSYGLYRTDEPEEALREAKLAIAATPRNPEAHTNLALAFESLHKFNAAAAEFQEALRLKPDYVDALRSLGRNDDAAHLEKRAQSIQSAQAGAN